MHLFSFGFSHSLCVEFKNNKNPGGEADNFCVLFAMDGEANRVCVPAFSDKYVGSRAAATLYNFFSWTREQAPSACMMHIP